MIRGPYRLAWLWYSLGVLLLLVVAIFSLIPMPQDDIGVDDKLSHLLAYALLSGWFSLLARQRTLLLWIVVGLVLYGIAIELLQSLTDYRFAEWGDVFANSLGALLGAGLYFTPAWRILGSVDRRLGAFFLDQ